MCRGRNQKANLCHFSMIYSMSLFTKNKQCNRGVYNSPSGKGWMTLDHSITQFWRFDWLLSYHDLWVTLYKYELKLFSRRRQWYPKEVVVLLRLLQNVIFSGQHHESHTVEYMP